MGWMRATQVDNLLHTIDHPSCKIWIIKAYLFIYRNYKCKHIVAALLHINAERTFEQLLLTDQPQKWGKVQKERIKEKYEPRMMIDLPCAKKVCVRAAALSNIMRNERAGDLKGDWDKDLRH